MNSQMLFDSMESLRLRWVDLAAAFNRLAVSVFNRKPGGDNDPAAKIDQSIFNVNKVGGLRQRCADFSGSRAEKLDVALQDLNDINKAYTTEDVLKKVITQFNEAKDGPDNSSKTILAEFNQITTDYLLVETIEYLDCTSRLARINEYIVRKIMEFREMQDGSGFTERFDKRGIRTSVENLAAYPILTSEVDAGGFSGGGSSAPVRSGGGGNATGSYQKLVNQAMREVLGRVPRSGDTRSFLASLNQSFVITEMSGQTTVAWNPRSFAGTTELGGGVTGAQASLYSRAKTASENALPLLDCLYSLREDEDEELVEAARSIVRSEIVELVNELGTEGGPRTARVNNLIKLLFEQDFSIDGNTSSEGHLGMLKHELGLEAANVNTLEEETNLTNFVAMFDYVQMIKTGWLEFRDAAGRDLGTQFVLLSRALSVAHESVDEVYATMDSVFVGASERLVASFRDTDGRRVLVGELLSWVSGFANDEAPKLIHEGGRRGVEALVPTVSVLIRLVDRLLTATASDGDLPEGMKQPRVRNAIRELRTHLQRIETLATELKLPSKVKK